jgi:ribokinase
MALIDIVMPNETEAALLTNSEVASIAEAKAAAGKLLAAGIKSVIITLGASGAISRTATACEHINSFMVAAVDTTAAGDCYAGALAVGMAEGKSLKESMVFAAAAAALSVTKAGAQPSLPWRHEVDEFIKSQGLDQ